MRKKVLVAATVAMPARFRGGVAFRRRVVVLALALALGVALALSAAGPAISNVARQTESVMNQNGVGYYAEDAAHLTRQTKGISIGVSVPVPQPNSYTYPETVSTPSASQGVITGWAFVFNNPEECADGPGKCSGPDLSNPDVGAGVYNFAGRPTGAGGNLVLTGSIQVGQTAGGPPGSTMAPLSNPGGAEVHVAIAPHGLIDPSNMPAQANTPEGNPACGCWWVAAHNRQYVRLTGAHMCRYGRFAPSCLQ
jgi:hypothetical protein